MSHACNLSTQETETGGLEFKASLDYIVRPYFNKQINKQGADDTCL
jgi:hypothetical protein